MNSTNKKKRKKIIMRALEQGVIGQYVGFNIHKVDINNINLHDFFNGNVKVKL